MATGSKSLDAFVRNTLSGPAQPEARRLAKRLAREYRGQALAVLYYGSCLRLGRIQGLILDFYVIVGDYRKAYGKRLPALANRLVPPNVYYFEAREGRETVRAKVAVISLEDFTRRTSPECTNVSLWARFSQPARLILCRDKKTEAAICRAVSGAHKTMILAALPLVEGAAEAHPLWSRALSLTYGAELRSEKESKGEELYQANREYYRAVTPLVLAEVKNQPLPSRKQAERAWRKRRLNGKAVSVLRLIKATFTFSGGVDYLVWKIERSSGVKVVLKPWQRQHPLVAGALLFLRLRRRGAFR